MILVTGASGNVGGAVLGRVCQSGSPVTAMFRSEADARTASPAMRTVIADFGDKESLSRAFAGVDSLFLVCSPIPQLVELESNAIKVAKEAGVRHVVLNSAMGAGFWPKSFPKWHTEAETVLRDSGVPYSILRPNTFMQNIVGYFSSTIQTQDAFYSSMGNSRVSLIDVEDIADAACALLTSGNPQNETYELNGPEALTYTEVAERISQVCGRAIRYVDFPRSEQRSALFNAGMPEWLVQALGELNEYYLAGHGGEVTDTVERLTGHKPKSLGEFLKINIGGFIKRAATA